MKLNTVIPALRRGLSRGPSARNRSDLAPSFRNHRPASPLTREQTRLAVIEVLG